MQLAHKTALPPLIVILGPTAVGKTEIAIQLAEIFSGEIVSADSRLFYRGMDIGTAKPGVEERQRVPHHLIDIADPDQPCSLAEFQVLAAEEIADIHARGRLPFLVGGTGQYIRAVTSGWQVPRVEPDTRLRNVLETWAGQIGRDGLHARLAVLDPQAADRIDVRNLRRTVRALEVIFTTGQRFSIQRTAGAASYRVLQLGLTRPRVELYDRIDARVDRMIELGLTDEVQNLLDRGYPAGLSTFSAIGYKEIIAHLEGKFTLEESVRQIKSNSHSYVRRQANWFKADDPQINWFVAGSGTVAEMGKAIEQFLKSFDSMLK
jgi:tRNA dimethylallyltransferase